MQSENMELGKELKARHQENKTWQADQDKLQKTNDQLKRRKGLGDEARSELELSRILRKSDTEILNREVEMVKLRTPTASPSGRPPG